MLRARYAIRTAMQASLRRSISAQISRSLYGSVQTMFLNVVAMTALPGLPHGGPGYFC